MNRRTLLRPDKFRSRVRQRRDLIGGYVCLVLVLEMAAHIIDHVRDLGVGQVRRSRRLLIRGLPKRRHAVSAVDDRQRHEFPRDELLVCGQFRIAALFSIQPFSNRSERAEVKFFAAAAENARSCG